MVNSILRRSAALACLFAFGCPRQELAPLNPCTVSAVSTRVDQTGISKVDLLFMVDNSGSMANKQLKLTQLLPRLVNVLTRGDRYYGRTPPAGISDKDRFFTPVTSLNLAVVDSSMGGVPDDGLPQTNVPQPALENCLGLGDDGRFQTSTEIATDGVVAVRDEEFPGRKAGDVILPPDPSCAGVAPPPYQTYDSANANPTPDQLSASFGCVARVGVRGCPFEQQLEAAWKAVAPSDGTGELFTFLQGSQGHGGANGDQAGFVRDDAILAIMEVTDEEDCSLTPDGSQLNSYSAEAASQFGPVSQINRRCYSALPEEDGLVWSTDRYVRAFKSLKPDNEDLVIFAAIVGIPLDAADQPYDDILARAEMQYGVLPGSNDQLPSKSCTNPSDSNEYAFPPRRLVRVAKDFGDNAVVYSICAEDYAPALDKLIDKIASKLRGNCLPRQLTPNTDGLVQCEVYELLPPNETTCTASRGHTGQPIPRKFASGTQTEDRLACLVNQVAVKNGVRDPNAVGWYYDDFSSDLKDQCNAGEQQRIEFSYGDLRDGAGAVIDCLQPVASVNPNAKGLAAIGSRCDPDPTVCTTRSDADYDLICTQNTCQISCDNNPDCPPGWECAALNDAGPKICQLATCPAAQTVDQQSGDAGG